MRGAAPCGLSSAWHKASLRGTLSPNPVQGKPLLPRPSRPCSLLPSISTTGSLLGAPLLFLDVHVTVCLGAARPRHLLARLLPPSSLKHHFLAAAIVTFHLVRAGVVWGCGGQPARPVVGATEMQAQGPGAAPWDA